MYRRSPSPVNLCYCGFDVLPNALSDAEHQFKHLEWAVDHQRGNVTTAARFRACRAYATALEDENRRLRVDVRDRDDRIEDLEAQLDSIHRQEAQ